MIPLFFFQLFFRSKKDFCATVIKVHLDSRSSGKTRMIFGKTRRNFLERKKKETKETKKTKKTKKKKKKKKKKQQQQRLFLFVRLSVCVSTTVISSYFVFRLLDPPSFFFSSRKKNCIDLSNQNRNDERERERKMFPSSLYVSFFFNPTVFVVAIFTAALWCLFWWRRRRAFAKGAQRVTTTIFDDF